MTDRDQVIYRGEQARRVMEDPIVVEALQTVRQAIRDQAFALPIEAREDRERLVMMDKMGQQFINWFEFAMRNGEVSKKELLMVANTEAKLEAIRERARNYAG